MTKTNVKEVLLSVLGTFACKVSILGCYPLIPAYFAAVYLEGRSRWMLGLFTAAGMLVFLPVTAAVKYGMALLVIIAAVRLCEWVDKRCYTAVAAGAAGLGMILISVFGGIFDFRNAVSPLLAVLEGAFIFGFVMTASRVIHIFLEDTVQKAPAPQPEEWKEERLLNYAQSFQGLSKTFAEMNKKVEFAGAEAGKIQDELTGRICAGCDCCAICWEPSGGPMYPIFSKMISALFHNGEADREIREELKEHCMYADHVINEALNVFERVRLNFAWYNRLLENREVIAQQLNAMAFIMEDCVNEAKLIDGEKRRELAEVRYRAKEYGICMEESHLYQKQNGHLQFYAKARSRWGSCISVKDLTKAVCLALDVRMCPHKDTRSFIGKETVTIQYEEEPAFHSVNGIARLVKDGAQISGDNFSVLEKDDGELVLSLSDGMGSGSAACKESELVIELLEKFIEAGFSKETAIRMMNSAMVIRGENDLYSTVDMSAVNLYNGEAKFYKIGASSTFIRHKDSTVECLQSTSLPAGVAYELEIEKSTKQLVDGDFLVMVTDGVLEYLHVPKPEETMEEIIGEIQTNHPGILAKKILERVMLYTGGSVRDDMTVLSAAVWEK